MTKECLRCGPVEVRSLVLFSGYGLVDPVTKEVIEFPDECFLNYDDDDLLGSLVCPKCGAEGL